MESANTKISCSPEHVATVCTWSSPLLCRTSSAENRAIIFLSREEGFTNLKGLPVFLWDAVETFFTRAHPRAGRNMQLFVFAFWRTDLLFRTSFLDTF